VMVGVGFDALVVQRMTEQRKGHITRWSYFGPIARSMLAYKFPQLQLTAISYDDTKLKWNACWAFVSNIPKYAASLPIAPWAVSDDGLLDVCTFENGGLLRSIRYLAYLFLNRHCKLKSFQTHRVKSLTIESMGRVPFQVDGDFGGELPLTIEVVPRRLTVVVN
jgi:diacylglycerol kinase (ATP)